jgi:hypothetical protein
MVADKQEPSSNGRGVCWSQSAGKSSEVLLPNVGYGKEPSYSKLHKRFDGDGRPLGNCPKMGFHGHFGLATPNAILALQHCQ